MPRNVKEKHTKVTFFPHSTKHFPHVFSNNFSCRKYAVSCKGRRKKKEKIPT